MKKESQLLRWISMSDFKTVGGNSMCTLTDLTSIDKKNPFVSWA